MGRQRLTKPEDQRLSLKYLYTLPNGYCFSRIPVIQNGLVINQEFYHGKLDIAVKGDGTVLRSHAAEWVHHALLMALDEWIPRGCTSSVVMSKALAEDESFVPDMHLAGAWKDHWERVQAIRRFEKPLNGGGSTPRPNANRARESKGALLLRTASASDRLNEAVERLNSMVAELTAKVATLEKRLTKPVASVQPASAPKESFDAFDEIDREMASDPEYQAVLKAEKASLERAARRNV